MDASGLGVSVGKAQLGVLLAALIAGASGIVFSLLLAFAAINLKADQTIGGTALNIFAPASDGEFFRVLKPGGILIAALPSEDHLFQLKSAIYDRPYRNPKPEYSPEGFELLKREEIRGRILLDSQEDIHNLFLMTPYYYKTGRADQEKLERCLQLETDIGFDVFVLRRKARP
jgi:23S rRNA (guanine745-N1)-methyltransferase